MNSLRFRFILKCTIEFREDTNRTYDCVFYPSLHGEYKVRVNIFRKINFSNFKKILITFNEQEVPNSPFLITVDLPTSDNVDSPGNELTRKLIEK